MYSTKQLTRLIHYLPFHYITVLQDIKLHLLTSNDFLEHKKATG